MKVSSDNEIENLNKEIRHTKDLLKLLYNGEEYYNHKIKKLKTDVNKEELKNLKEEDLNKKLAILTSRIQILKNNKPSLTIYNDGNDLKNQLNLENIQHFILSSFNCDLPQQPCFGFIKNCDKLERVCVFIVGDSKLSNLIVNELENDFEHLIKFNCEDDAWIQNLLKINLKKSNLDIKQFETNKQTIVNQSINNELVNNQIVSHQLISNQLINDQISNGHLNSQIISNQIIKDHIINNQINNQINNHMVNNLLINNQMIKPSILAITPLPPVILNPNILNNTVILNNQLINSTTTVINQTLATPPPLSTFINQPNLPIINPNLNNINNRISNNQQFKRTINDHPFTRKDLLLSVRQLIKENYPLPFNGNLIKKTTKLIYRPVNELSPMFALDCEMCKTINGDLDVTRISLIDEELNILLDEYVKPKYQIIDYLTQYSGVTKEHLENIDTTLEDIHLRLDELLPEDAILIGHSLNCDLQSLQLSHPYIIDTSCIYNFSYYYNSKPSLKQLANFYLKNEIQNKDNGHCSVEDAKAAMQLVKLKLSKDITFGDNRFINCNSKLFKPVMTLNEFLNFKKQFDIKIVYDYLELENIPRFISVTSKHLNKLVDKISWALSLKNSICIVILKGKLMISLNS